jgi:hypothetical protein
MKLGAYADTGTAFDAAAAAHARLRQHDDPQLQQLPQRVLQVAGVGG